ncbi:multicopper oxidase family protein [Novosphingobium terrae]|uniref:multicopper oxidase family protein n=1 Tax=Novosphingobium terrae TaxID=2726189 RepID=UPI0019821A7D|nr:multicopper oxidase family protein [Novosphingobium terrae]
MDMKGHAMGHEPVAPPPVGKADHTLRIEPCKLEIAPGVTVETTAFNGQVPGPMLQLKKGVPTTIDVINATDVEDLTHWHGLHTDVRNDGAMEQGASMIKPGETFRYHLTPEPSGTRWYHTHAMAGDNLNLGGYSGQFGFLTVDGGPSPGDYDQEHYLAIHHWVPHFVPMVMQMQAISANRPVSVGSDVAYKYATVNSHCLGAGEPLRVKKGQRVLLHLLNASATENVVMALPGHTFKVIALDGNPVPNPRKVETLSIAVAERIDCIVEMDNPGVWILGSTLPEVRDMGLGIVVEYAGEKGRPVWHDVPQAPWDYRQFASETQAPTPDKVFNLQFIDVGTRDGSMFDTWTINGKAWPEVDPLLVEKGKRYRMLFHNLSGDQHPMHLHRHSFEVVAIDGKPMSGLIKDTVNVLPYQRVAVDFIADNPGDTIYHCHMQLHMDHGFLGMIKYV